MFASASLASPLGYPFHVLFSLWPVFALDLEISKLDSMMFATGSPSKEQGIVKPNCAQKTVRCFIAQLLLVPQHPNLSFGQTKSFIGLLSFGDTASCLRFEDRASLAFVNCLSMSKLYCFPCSRNTRSKLRNTDVSVSGSYSSPFCFRTLKKK